MTARALRRTTASIALLTLTLTTVASSATLYAVGGNAGPIGGLTGLYTVDPSTAIMTWVGSPNVSGNYDNSILNGGLAYDPYTDRLYALGCDHTGASALFIVDRSDASMVRVGYCNVIPSGAFCSGGLAFDITSGRLFAVGGTSQGQSSALYEVDPSTGVAQFLGGNGPPGTFVGGLACDPQTGVLYANGFAAYDQISRLFTLDKNTGAGTFIGGHGLTQGRQMNYAGPAVSPSTGVMYSMGSFTSSVNHLYTVNKSTGVATSVGPATPNGIGVDGALVYVGTDVLDATPSRPTLVSLRAYPNPTRVGVAFAFGLTKPGRASLTIVDLAGRRVSVPETGWQPAGLHTIEWDGTGADGRRAAPGIYFAMLRQDGALMARTTVMLVR